jgi:anti-sigma factor RsiW
MSDVTAQVRPRPAERDALLNPAFVALLLAYAARGHHKRTQGPLPLSLCFLVAPMVLHAPTRGALPRRVTARFGGWLGANPLLRADMASHARAVAPAVRSGLREGLRAGVLTLSGDLVEGRPPRRPPGLTLSVEVEDILKRAEFVGGWLGLAGPPAAIYAMWCVKP